MYKETHGLLPSDVVDYLIDPLKHARPTTRLTSGSISPPPQTSSVTKILFILGPYLAGIYYQSEFTVPRQHDDLLAISFKLQVSALFK